MKLFNFLFLIGLITLQYHHSYAIDKMITFFIKQAEQQNHRIGNKKNKKGTPWISAPLQQPSFIYAIGKDRSWLHQPGIDGIHAIYLGFMAISDHNGQIQFPLKQQHDSIHLLITPQINPDMMLSPTLIESWTLQKETPFAMYKIDRKRNKKLNLYYFQVTKIDPPAQIPLDTIIILADPETIKVPIGICLNTYSDNFILPELQALKKETVKNSLYTLSIKQYFEQINKNSQHSAKNIADMIVNQ